VEIIEQFSLSQRDLYWKLAHLPPAGGLVRKYNWVYWYDQRLAGKAAASATSR
jgi:hypothetical protein